MKRFLKYLPGLGILVLLIAGRWPENAGVLFALIGLIVFIQAVLLVRPDSKLANFFMSWDRPRVDREKWDEYRKGGGDPKY